MALDSKLKQLFDYQKFEENPKLARLVKAASSENFYELSDEELTCVAAAGDPYLHHKSEDQ